MMDRRALPSLALGGVGGLLGVGSAVLRLPVLGLAAGAAAAGSAVLAAVMVRRLHGTTLALISRPAAGDPPGDAGPSLNSAVSDTRGVGSSVGGSVGSWVGSSVGGSGSSVGSSGAITPGLAGNRGPESVFDEDTGLLDERVFVVTFERKVAAARRHLRPLSVVLLDIGPGASTSVAERRAALARFGAVVRETLRDSDIACRVGSTSFGLILEDTPEAGGVWAAERLQIAMASAGDPPVVGSVATYPNHGLAPHEVLLRAREALAVARSRTTHGDGMGRVEVASLDLT